jgi:hypothetical protein
MPGALSALQKVKDSQRVQSEHSLDGHREDTENERALRVLTQEEKRAQVEVVVRKHRDKEKECRENEAARIKEEAARQDLRCNHTGKIFPNRLAAQAHADEMATASGACKATVGFGFVEAEEDKPTRPPKSTYKANQEDVPEDVYKQLQRKVPEEVYKQLKMTMDLQEASAYLAQIMALQDAENKDDKVGDKAVVTYTQLKSYAIFPYASSIDEERLGACGASDVVDDAPSDAVLRAALLRNEECERLGYWPQGNLVKATAREIEEFEYERRGRELGEICVQKKTRELVQTREIEEKKKGEEFGGVQLVQRYEVNNTANGSLSFQDPKAGAEQFPNRFSLR